MELGMELSMELGMELSMELGDWVWNWGTGKWVYCTVYSWTISWWLISSWTCGECAQRPKVCQMLRNPNQI